MLHERFVCGRVGFPGVLVRRLAKSWSQGGVALGDLSFPSFFAPVSGISPFGRGAEVSFMDVPGVSGVFPASGGVFPERNGGVTARNGGVTAGGGVFPARNGGVTASGGVFPVRNGGVTPRNGGGAGVSHESGGG